MAFDNRRFMRLCIGFDGKVRRQFRWAFARRRAVISRTKVGAASATSQWSWLWPWLHREGAANLPFVVETTVALPEGG